MMEVDPFGGGTDPLLLFFLLIVPVSASAKDIGELSANLYQQNSTDNPYGAGSPFAPNGINNPSSPYGNHLRSFVVSFSMPFKTSKPRPVTRKQKGVRKPAGFDKLPAKRLPDTSRIPWFPAIKTGTDV
jgi:hypothetical protein